MKDIFKKIFRFLMLSPVLVVVFVSFVFFSPSIYSSFLEVFSTVSGLDFSLASRDFVLLLICFVFWTVVSIIDFLWDFLFPLFSRAWSFFKRLFHR